jgi:hypothetical protein
MAERRSRSIEETRDKEVWLVHLVENDAERREELGALLRTAALTRAAATQIEVPPGAEEASHQRGLAALAALRGQPAPGRPRAAWYTRLGSAMRFVFTLGRRR